MNTILVQTARHLQLLTEDAVIENPDDVRNFPCLIVPVSKEQVLILTEQELTDCLTALRLTRYAMTESVRRQAAEDNAIINEAFEEGNI